MQAMTNQYQNKSFKIYKASAGSGKTFTIVKEFLTLCLGADTDTYNEILAVTFTNKAASEMKAKILRFLLDISERSQEDDIIQMRNYLLTTLKIDEDKLVSRAKRMYVNILHDYSDFAVCTIDSFVQKLSRTFAKELGLPSQYSLILDKEDLIDEIIQRISNEIGKDNFITPILSSFVKYNLSEETSWNLKDLIGDFIRRLLSEDAYRRGNINSFTVIDEDKFKEIKEYIRSEKEKITKLLPKIVDEIEAKEEQIGITDQDYFGKAKSGLPSVKRKMLEEKNEITTPSLELILEGGKSWKDAKSKIQGDAIVDVYKNAIERYKSLYSKSFVISEIEKDLHLYVLRNHILELIRVFINESSQVHISEFNKRISDILGDCSVPFIYERIGEKYKHFFIDEFQDTSVLQWHNFLPLVENSLASLNMNMIVGDAKQSIYRFRGGEVEQIIQLPEIYDCPDNAFGHLCQDRFINSAQKMTLGTNYRSSKNVVKFNNTFFRFVERFLPKKCVYNDAEQIYDGRKEEGFVSVTVFPGELKSAEYKEKVKAAMLAKIKELQVQGVEYKDITILVRYNDDGSDIANYLVEHGIGVLSAESVLLQSSDKVQLIISTLKLMMEPDNPITQKEVEHFINSTNSATATYRDAIHRISDDAINRDYPSYNIYDLCIQICKSYNFNVVDDVFLQYFMNVVFDWQNVHSSGIGDFLEFWEKKKDKLAVQISGNLNCVQIMSIHKAKGLEFKVVFYPYANTNLQSRRLTQDERWLQCSVYEETKDIPYLDAFMLKLTENLKGTTFENLRIDEERETKLDILDLMYVAMTRAKNMLFVYTNDKKPTSGKSDNKYNLFTDFFNGNLNDIQHVKSGDDDPDFKDYFIKNGEFDFVKGEEMKIYNYGNLGKTLKINEKKKKDDKIKILELKEGETAPKSLNWFEKLKVKEDPTMLWAEKGTFLPEEWGSLVHQILSKIHTIADAESALRPYVKDGTIDEKQAAELLATFRMVTEIPELKPAFSDDAIVKNEMDIHTYDGKLIRPDRYAETPHGTILIDYKTGKKHSEYKDKLRDYMSALMQMNGNQDIKAYLVYLGDEIRIDEVIMDRLF